MLKNTMENREMAEPKNKRKENEVSSRKKRVGLGMFKKEMTIQPGLIKPGYVPRWINDDGDRLEVAQNGGYEFVYDKRDSKAHVGEAVESGNTSIDSRISKIVDKTPRMTGERRAYLMQIKQEYYDEDQREKMKKVDELADTIKHGKAGMKKEDQGDFYADLKIS